MEQWWGVTLTVKDRKNPAKIKKNKIFQIFLFQTMILENHYMCIGCTHIGGCNTFRIHLHVYIHLLTLIQIIPLNTNTIFAANSRVGFCCDSLQYLQPSVPPTAQKRMKELISNHNYHNTLIHRLTKIIRYGIRFVSRNLRQPKRNFPLLPSEYIRRQI